MSRGTLIRPTNNDAEKIPYPAIQEVPFANVPLLAGKGSAIDIVAVVTNVKEPRLIEARGKLTTIRECTIMQQELKPLMLTLWGDFADQQGTELFTLRTEMPIILCKGLRATNFAGISLSTIPFSFVVLEPTIPEVIRLRTWLSKHKEDVQQIDSRPTQSYLESAMVNVVQSQLTKLSDILPDSQAVQCATTMAIVDLQQKVTYTVCPKCKQTQKAIPNENFPCHTCNEEQIAEPRCKVVIHLTDKSSNIEATLFDKCAEKLLSHTPKEMYAMNKQETVSHLQKINEKLGDQEVIAQIRAMKKKFNDKVTRYTVQDWIEKKTDTSTTTESSNTGKSSQEAKNMETLPSTSTEDSPSKKTKAESNTDPEAPSKTNTTPMKKLKLRPIDEN